MVLLICRSVPKLTKQARKTRKNGKVNSFDQLFLVMATVLNLIATTTTTPAANAPPSRHTHVFKRARVRHTYRTRDNSKNIFWMACFAFEMCFIYSLAKLKACHHPADKLRPNDLPHLARRSHSDPWTMETQPKTMEFHFLFGQLLFHSISSNWVKSRHVKGQPGLTLWNRQLTGSWANSSLLRISKSPHLPLSKPLQRLRPAQMLLVGCRFIPSSQQAIWQRVSKISRISFSVNHTKI